MGSSSAWALLLLLLCLQALTLFAQPSYLQSQLPALKLAAQNACSRVVERANVADADITCGNSPFLEREGCNISVPLVQNCTYSPDACQPSSCIAVSTTSVATMSYGMDSSTSQVRQRTVDRMRCRMQNLGGDYANIANSNGLATVAAGFAEGFYVEWPARNWKTQFGQQGCPVSGSTCNIYDPRKQSWFMSAATGRKTIILILDVSSNMKDNTGPALLSAAAAVLDTLSHTDWVMVVALNDTAIQPPAPLSGVVVATKSNIEGLKAFVQSFTQFTGNANFTGAFGQVFTSLKESLEPFCRPMILFATAGRITAGETNLVRFLASTEQKGSIPIMTFAIENAADAGLLKTIACNSGGMFFPSVSTSGILKALNNYYQYFLESITDQVDLVWSEPAPLFGAASGSALYLTASLPCFQHVPVTSSPFFGVTSFSINASSFNPDDILQLRNLTNCASYPAYNVSTLENLRNRLGAEVCDNTISLALGLGIAGAFVLIVIVVGIMGCCGCFDVVLAVFYGLLVLTFMPIMVTLPWRPVFMFMGVFGSTRAASVGRGYKMAMLHLGLWFLDVFTLVPLVFVLATLVRLPSLFTSNSNIDSLKKITQKPNIHGHIWWNFLLAWRDIFLYYFLTPLTLLQPWRFVFLMLDWYNATSFRQRRRAVLNQWTLMVFDLFSVPFFAVAALIAPWRWPSLNRSFSRRYNEGYDMAPCCIKMQGSSFFLVRNSATVHAVMWRHILSVAVDLFAAPFIIFTLIMPFRTVGLAYGFLYIRDDAVSRWRIIGYAAFLTVLDILSIPAAVLIFATVYRFPTFRRGLLDLVDNVRLGSVFLNDIERTMGAGVRLSFTPYVHRYIWYEAGQVVCDIGVLLLWLLSWVAPWRPIMALIDIFGREEKQGCRRIVVINQFYLAYGDVGTLIPALFQLLTVYRIFDIIGDVKAKVIEFHNRRLGFDLKPADPERGGFLWSHAALASRYTTKIHRVVWYHFGIFLVDVFCLFAGPLTLVLPWRGFWFGRDVWLAERARHRRLAAFVNLVLLCLDILTLPFLLIIVLTIYRVPTLLRNCRRVAQDVTTSTFWGNWIRPAQPDENWYRLFHSPKMHELIMIQAGHIALDLLVIVVAIITLCAPWRFACIVVSVVNASKVQPGQQPPSRGTVLHYRRMAPLIQFTLMLLDFLYFPFFVPVLLSVFRFVICISLWKSEVMNSAANAKLWGFDKNMRTLGDDEKLTILMHSPRTHITVLFMFVALVLEIVGACCTALTLAMPWRFVTAVYDIIKAPSFSESKFSRLRAATYQLLMTLVDILTLVPMILLSLTFYRMPRLIAKLKAVSVAPTPKHPCWLAQDAGKIISVEEMPAALRCLNTFDMHRKIWFQFFNLLLDGFVLLSGALCIVMPWRLVWAISDLKQAIDENKPVKEKRLTVLRQCGLAFLDVAIIPMLAILAATPWRAVAFVFSITLSQADNKHITHKNARVHKLVGKQMALLAADIATIFPALFLTLTMYRLIVVAANVSKEPKFSTARAKLFARLFIVHRHIWIQFFWLVADAFSVFMGVLCVVTIIPAVFLIRKLTKSSKLDKWSTWRNQFLFWGLLTIPLWLASPALILSFVMVPFWFLLRLYYSDFKHINPLPETYLSEFSKWIVKECARNGTGTFFSLGIGTLFALLFTLFNWAMLLVAGFNLLIFSLLSFGLPFCPSLGCWRNSCKCCHKGAFFVTWWILCMPIIGFIQFILWHLPRVIVHFNLFWSTIFKLCPTDTRGTPACNDFYARQLPVDDTYPWWAMFLFWLIIYAHSVPYFLKYSFKHVWGAVP